MELLFLYGDNGLGHVYRSTAAMCEAYKRGHTASVLTPGGIMIMTAYLLSRQMIASATGASIKHYLASNRHHFDWLIVDTKRAPSRALVMSAHDAGCKVAYLNSIPGRSYPGVDLVWPQNDPQRVIIGSDVRSFTPNNLSGLTLDNQRRPVYKGREWFIYGGGGDLLNLASYTRYGSPGQYTIVELSKNTSTITTPKKKTGYKLPRDAFVNRLSILSAMVRCRAALIHMGTIAWELAYLRVPTYIVSSTPKHLDLALNMERLGLARAWPKIGLPTLPEASSWLDPSWRPLEAAHPDGAGVSRFMEALENA